MKNMQIKHTTVQVDKGPLVSMETVVLNRWAVETNVWFINRVDKVIWPGPT